MSQNKISIWTPATQSELNGCVLPWHTHSYNVLINLLTTLSKPDDLTEYVRDMKADLLKGLCFLSSLKWMHHNIFDHPFFGKNTFIWRRQDRFLSASLIGWLVLINVFVPLGALILLSVYWKLNVSLPWCFQHSSISQNDTALLFLRHVKMLLFSGWVLIGMISVQENALNPWRVWIEQSFVFTSVNVYRSCWLLPLSLIREVRFHPLLRSIFPLFVFSNTCCHVFSSLKQTHICAVLATVATSEGSVFGLYLELWPSQSAAVPARRTPMESPANPAHPKALVWKLKSPQWAFCY